MADRPAAELSDVAAILSRIAGAIADAKHGWDYEEMSPEDAFNAAMGAVSTAISEAVGELRLKGSLEE